VSRPRCRSVTLVTDKAGCHALAKGGSFSAVRGNGAHRARRAAEGVISATRTEFSCRRALKNRHVCCGAPTDARDAPRLRLKADATAVHTM